MNPPTPPSSTPETDAKCLGNLIHTVDADFARKLERKRDEKQRILETTQQMFLDAKMHKDIAEQERDSLQFQLKEANDKIEILKDACDRSDTMSDERLAQLSALRKDKERLDWLETQHCQVYRCEFGAKLTTWLDPYGKDEKSFIDTSNIRTAIDTAIQSSKPA